MSTAKDTIKHTQKQVDNHNPTIVQELLDQGIRWHRAGNLCQAQTLYRQILELNPRNVHALNNLGASFQEQGRNKEAIDCYEMAISIDPGSAYGYYNLGNACRSNEQLDAAIGAYKKAISLNQQYADAYNNLGLCLQDQGLLDEAILAYKKAVHLRPDYAEVHNNFGNALQQKGLLHEAIERLDRALSLKKDYADAHSNKGVALQKQGKLAESLAEYRHALAIKQDFPDAHINLAHALLLQGDFARGLLEYEWRWRVKGQNYQGPRSFQQPVWDGSDISGKTILLHTEQGYGDTIQFVRYASLVAKKGGRVIVECQPLLARLLSMTNGIYSIIPQGATLPDFEVHAPLMSLPLIFGTTPATIPAPLSYLTPPATRPIKFLSQGTNKKVGIVWAGSRSHANDRNRSCAIYFFQTLMDVAGYAWFSLQKGDAENDLKRLDQQRMRPEDLSAHIHDFADTAAIIDQLDLIISVDTAVAHLAGALGKTVWLLLPYVPDWRWMMKGSYSPWYPTMRLFRQTTAGDWSGLFQRVRDTLTAHQAWMKRNTLGVMQPHEANSSDNVGPTTYEKAVRLHQAGKTDEAIKSYRAVLKTHPDDGNLHNNLAVALHSQNRFDEAIQHYHAALTIDRDRPETLNNLAAAYKRKGDLDLAIHHYNLCLTLCPDYPEAHNNLGLALQKQGNIYDAIDHYQKAVTLDPDYVDARFHLSMALLLNGELKDGFALYDWRWRRRDWPPLPSQSLHWDGSPLMGKTLLITAEQGFGDTIQFIRYIGLIPKDGGHILVECQKPLLELFKCLQGIDGLFPQGKTLPAHDIYAPMMSLPRICGTTLETIPADIPYILSPQNHALNLENFPGTRLKIGIAWAGNPQHVNDAERSCRPDHFIPLFNMAEIRFYSLQKDCPVPAEMIKKYDQLVDLADRLEDFTDTAAFIDQLDLVIAVDTAVIHLAGAMGKPVWALLPYVPDWRWLMDRMDTPWYPTMRLFRQTQPSDWGSVFQKVRQTLCEFIA